MLNCPFCKADLGKLDSFPENCPNCGKGLMMSDDAHASVQLISDSGPSGQEQRSATVESTDSSQLPAPDGSVPVSSEEAARLSKTFISDEWDDPSNSGTVESGEIGDSAEGTNFVLQAQSGDHHTPQLDSAEDPSLGKTVQSGEIPSAEDDSGKTMESTPGDDPSLGKTVHSEDFALEDAVPGAVGGDQEFRMGQRTPKRNQITDEPA